jgi:hypothetical protein
MPRSKAIEGVGDQPCALIISNHPRAFTDKSKKKPTITAEERKAKALKRKLKKCVYGEASQRRRQTKPNVRRRNARLCKEVHSYKERHDLFATLRSPFSTNDPAGVERFKEAWAMLRAAYLHKLKPTNGAALFWLEKSDKLMIHAHMLCYTKSSISAEELEAWLIEKWSAILKKVLARYDRLALYDALGDGLVKVTPYHEAQLGYFAKGTKARDSRIMLMAADGLATFGIWNKTGLTPADTHVGELTDEDRTSIQREAMIYMYEEARKTGRQVNHTQEGRILSGDFATFYMTKERLLALDAQCGGRILGRHKQDQLHMVRTEVA